MDRQYLIVHRERGEPVWRVWDTKPFNAAQAAKNLWSLRDHAEHFGWDHEYGVRVRTFTPWSDEVTPDP